MPTRAVTTAIPSKELVVATGNYDESRAPKIDRIILHTMVGSWQSAASRFATYASGNGPASAHYGIGVDGKLYHWLEEYWTAYHAGNYDMNQRSIGIECEDLGNYNSPRPDALYQTAAKLVADICRFYGFPADHDHIKIHKEVSDKPTACPDSLDTERIIREAAALLAPATNPGQAPAPTPSVDYSLYVQPNADPNQVKLQVDGLWYERQALKGIITDKATADKRVVALTAQVSDLQKQLAARPATAPISVAAAKKAILATDKKTRLSTAVELVKSL